MYDVVLLVEQELTEPDAKRVVELHEQRHETVRYHVIIPCENAAAGVEASLSALGGADLYVTGGGLPVGAADLQPELTEAQQEAQREAQRSIDDEARTRLDRSLKRLQVLDQQSIQADGIITHEPPVDALIEQVKRVGGEEVIVLTRPHVVAEFFHVDWSAQARRHLGVPVLHLLEAHQGSATEPDP
jgi:hypothetical protein